MAYECGAIREVHSDERRRISEFNGSNCSVQKFLIFSDNLPLGRHFHRNKAETFVILKGGGVVLLCDTDHEGNRFGEVRHHDLYQHSVIVIEPRTAHTFYLTPGTEMLCHSSTPFDPDQPDMYVTNWLVRA